jgi:hypothetical protein
VLFRILYVAWRTAIREAVIWHGTIAVAIALAVAVVVLMADRGGSLRPSVCALPIAGAGVYSLAIALFRFRSVWREFPHLRREMRRRRQLELHLGGIRRREFLLRTFLRVRLPYLAMTAGAVILLGALPTSMGRELPQWVTLCGVAVITIAALTLNAHLTRRNEQHRPRNLQRYCPRCGYDLLESRDRCPECGLRKVEPYPVRPLRD